MKKSERTLLIATVAIGIAAVAYVQVIEPHIQRFFAPSSGDARNRKYLDIFNRKEEILKQAQRSLRTKYWKKTLQEQQMAFQIYVENSVRESGISRIKSIAPAASGNEGEQIALKLDMECSLGSLSKFLLKVGSSDVPVQVRKLQIYGETGELDTIKVQLELASLWMNI